MTLWPFMLKRTHRREMNALARENTKALTVLGEKYILVQYGYDQGVLEGKRHAFSAVRASLADLMFNAPLMRAPLTSILSGLGQEETRLLDEMKGIDRGKLEESIQAQTGKH